jgi:hypothetical protein
MNHHVVQVRALTEKGIDKRPGPYSRAGIVFEPGWKEHVVSDEQLKTLEVDHWLEVRVLDERSQAARKMEFALEASLVADNAEAKARELRAHADELMANAKAALEKVKHEPPPAPAPAATPFKDAMIAAMPDAVRASMPAPSKSGKGK